MGGLSGESGMNRKIERVLISGVSGYIGRHLLAFLQGKGYQVSGLSRTGGFFLWDPARGWIDPDALDGIDAVIHLAGENIASGRWTTARKKRILDSRILGTSCLVEALSGLPDPPSVFLSASGTNYYQEGIEVDEEGPPGQGFLGEVCQKWEGEAMRAADAGIRCACLRTGVVLSPDGGALKKLLPIYRAGLGGVMGSGRQGFPWIGLHDLLRTYEFCLLNESIRGPVNAVHPDLVNQAQFSRTLSKLLSRKSLFRVPAWAIRLLLGQMGQEALLADLRIRPGVLLHKNFTFKQHTLEECLTSLLSGKKAFHL
jgi:uncharacterized protein (TIGR01777 family)